MNNTFFISMETLFRGAGYNYIDLEPETSVDISDKNIYISCFDHNLNRKVKRKILSLVRKNDDIVFEVYTKNPVVTLLRATGDHKVYNPVIKEYTKLRDNNKLHVLTNLAPPEHIIEAFVRETVDKSPILDLEVEGLGNYFSNSILSHNTGGQALKFYASQRLDIRRKKAVGEDSSQKTGVEAHVKVVKNKVAPPFREADFIINFNEGIDWVTDLYQQAINSGRLIKQGASFLIGEEKIGYGYDAFLQAIRHNPELAARLRELI